MRVQRTHGNLLKKSRGTKTEPVVKTTKGPDTRRTAPLKMFCVCGKKMLTVTKEDVWNGIQPRCERCPTDSSDK